LIKKEGGGRREREDRGGGSQAQQAEEQKQKKVQLASAVQKFNMKAKTGVAYLGECGLLPQEDGPDKAAQLARLFKETAGFEKTMLGEYMGEGGTEKTKFNVTVLHAFIDTYDFAGVTFSDSLRTLLKGFRCAISLTAVFAMGFSSVVTLLCH